MIYDKIIKDFISKSINLKELIENGNVIIQFQNNFIDEFNLPAKEGSIGISIRNKYLNGHNGQSIEHDPTIKVSVTKSGLPITIEHDHHLHKNSDTTANRKKIAPYMPMIKKFIFENRKDLIKYWFADPNTEKGVKDMEKLERKIINKYIREDN